MDSSNNKLVMSEKPNPDPNQHPLKCPRCDSSNTKFCYYNNYSLSQPRHFCKACKRYWTRGGTLRNVPVGGGCRKNKRVKRPQPTGSGDGISSATTSHIQPSNIDLTSSGVSNMSTNMNGSLFYNPIELNFPYPGFSSTRVSLDRSGGAGFDLQSQMNNTSIGGGGGLGFFSGLMANNGAHNHGRSQEFNSGDPAGFVGSSASSMASLLVSSLQQPSNGFTGFSQYDNQDLRMARGEQNGGKEVKMEWNNNQIHHGQQINGSDSSSLLWNSNNNNIGYWFDPSNMSSSVSSLI